MAVFIRQVWTLIAKNLRIVFIRHPFATIIRALIIPIALLVFFSYAKYIFVPDAVYGIGTSRPLMSLSAALAKGAASGRETVAFSNGGFSNGAIDAVIDTLVAKVEAAGSRAVRLTNDSALDSLCPSSLRGVTTCYGAVSFTSSPSEGSSGIWGYTFHQDGALGLGKIHINKDTNDGEVYSLPFQHAIDAAIVAQQTGNDTNVIASADVHEYPFTSITAAQRDENIRVSYQATIVKYLGVAFISGIVGICYHLAGFVATEREIGMSTLIDSMMTTSVSGQRWGEAQIARMLSSHLSFTLLYMPGWIVGSAIVGASVFSTSNAAVIILYHMLAGIAFASTSLFGASFFRRAQLSGISITIIFLVLAIVSQLIRPPKTATVAVLSLLFAPCNYVFFIGEMARFERYQLPTNLLQSPPNSPWNLPGIVLWIFLGIQIVVYPVLGIYVERYLHGTTTTGRTILVRPPGSDANTSDIPALKLEGFYKTYTPGPLRRAFGWVKPPSETVHAVRDLTLTAGRGQILVLLGANGSGKSTTLDSIAGISKLTSGRIIIDGTGGLGIAPQKNVMWDEVTVEEHLHIFNRLKSPLNLASKEEIRQLVATVDLEIKANAFAKTLSGGQQRKLQLGMMLTGGSTVCCVDEVSSGLDPLSRRKIWDILLAERGHRTIIMTTHFLDEADLLSDKIAVLSKGTLRAEGSSAALKEKLGGGYRIHVPKNATVRSERDLPDVDGVAKKNSFDLVTYVASSSNLAAQVIRTLQTAGVADYRFSGPTLEDVFLQLAEEAQNGQNGQPEPTESSVFLGNDSNATIVRDRAQSDSDKTVSTAVVPGPDDANSTEDKGLQLMPGRQIGYWQQARVLFQKRLVVCKSNWLPSAVALILPIIAAGLVTMFVQSQTPPSCTPSDRTTESNMSSVLASGYSLHLIVGPSAKVADTARLMEIFTPMFTESSSLTNSSDSNESNTTSIMASVFANITLTDSLTDFNSLVVSNRKNVTPAGFWLGDDNTPPTIAYYSDSDDQVHSLYGQNFMNAIMANMSIGVSYSSFATPWAPDTGKSLQLLVYMCLAFSAYVGFFSLYPNLERRHNVRGLQYSNGVRALPLWLAYVAFDFAIVLVSSVVIVILFAALSHVWYHVGYLFIIFALYGLSSALLAYFISLFCSNQLSAYAFTAALQAVTFLVYLIAYLCTITYAPVNKIDTDLLIVHFIMSAVAPIGSIVRALFVSLNLFSTSCSGEAFDTNPGGITLYGGSILYLIVQTFVYFGLVLWFDSGDVAATLYQLSLKLRRRKAQVVARSAKGGDDARVGEPTIVLDLPGVEDGACGLRVDHVTKTFGHYTAVDNVSFTIGHGEVFALLGPNGAGKSTTISMVRGDVKPDDGDVLVEAASVTKHLAAARASLGVCPQFDAVDQMTVREHLLFYARVRGITDVAHNVEAIIQAVGLSAFRDRQAHALSGGNKRKLSLGIALMGNPAVVLLDEPSSGLDAAAKRVMWRTLAAAAAGRSILLTTHSMEEADALAGRAGILARRMLAAGSTDALRARFGNRLFVHVVSRGAPHTPEAEMARLRTWVQTAFPGAEIEDKTYHGQMRFAIPVAEAEAETEKEKPSKGASMLGHVVVRLDEQREAMGIAHFSVSPTTLDQVFLTIVGQHNVQEEGYHHEERAAAVAAPKKWWQFRSA